MKWGLPTHEIGSGLTDQNAIGHKPCMRGFSMVNPELQAMTTERVKAFNAAMIAGVDTCIHVFISRVHWAVLIIAMDESIHVRR